MTGDQRQTQAAPLLATIGAAAPVRSDTSAVPTAPSGRQCVLWLGGEPPAEMYAVVASRGWRLRPVSTEELVGGVPLRTARGLVIEVSNTVVDAGDSDPLVAAATPHIDAALANGVPVAFVPEASGASMTLIAADRIQRFCQVSEPIVERNEPRINRCARDWTLIAQWMDAHSPGPAASLALQLDGDLPTDDELEAELLLRRAFHDAERVTLTRIAGGKSGAAVWSATPHASDTRHRASPFLVKYNTLVKTRTEQSRYALYADERVSFRLRPPIHRARCVEGQTHGLLVFDFIERAVPFRAALTTYAPGQLVGSLFGHTLAGCLRGAREVTQPLAPAFRRIKVLNWSDALAQAAAAARLSDTALPDVTRLREMIESLPAMSHRVATAHGDLHTGNLLVAAGSSDVLLIDFGSIELGMPVATDPACLEVSLTFVPEDARSELGGRTAPGADVAWLREAYRYPLDPYAVPERYGREAWVADAVRAIRGFVRQLEPTVAAFAVATASYLIRYASYSENGSVADRAFAYELAARLILAVHVENGARANQKDAQDEVIMIDKSTSAA